MRSSLIFSNHLADELRLVANGECETAGVLLASLAEAPNGDLRVLARGIRWVPENAYDRRDWNGLTIRPEGYVHALAEAESLNAFCIWVHTHPGQDGIPLPSKWDLIVDQQISDLFRLRSGHPYYGTLIVSPRTDTLIFSGTLEKEGAAPIPIDRLWEVGDRWRLTRAFNSTLQPLPELFDRNVRAFGNPIQQMLNDLTVGIAGCGGTGSAVAEQLVRLGVRRFVLLDPDLLSTTNVTRVYGSGIDDVGLPKVDVLAKHLRRIAPDVCVKSVRSMITMEAAARRLLGCDLVFGCTDDNAGRLVLSRIASYLLTPVIDCGVLLSSDDSGQLTGINGRCTVLSPGSACLVCRGRIDLARANSELLTPEERIRREREGYAPALGQREPAVVAFTTIVAATAVSELLERLIGYGPTDRPGEVLLRCHEREISTNVALPREGHYCDPSSGKLGLGITEPFLEQTWPS
jgi:hypothetical protein